MRLLILACAVLVSCAASPKPTDQPNRVVVSPGSISILDPITFVGDTAELAPSSSPLLDSTATTLRDYPTIKLVEVVVHGADKALSGQRANAIRDQLIARRVTPERLRAAAGDQGTPRTDFVILERATEQP